MHVIPQRKRNSSRKDTPTVTVIKQAMRKRIEICFKQHRLIPFTPSLHKAFYLLKLAFRCLYFVILVTY